MRRLTVEILEVGQLDALAHTQYVGGGAKAVDQHPEVTGIQGRDLARGVAAALNGVLDVSPGGNEGTEHHQAEGEESQRSDRSTEPEDLTVGD